MSLVQRLQRAFAKVAKNILRSLLFWRRMPPGEQFVRASEATHIRYLKAEFWQHDEALWVYFMYLNLPIVIVLYFGGYQMIFLDLLLIFFVSTPCSSSVSLVFKVE